jgi:hypothetical protein
MNKIILFIVLHLSISAWGQTTVYHYPLSPDSSVWQQDYFNQPGPGCTQFAPYCYSYRDRMQGDTLISGRHYKKVTETHLFGYYYNGGVSGFYTGDSLYYTYRGAVRQDTLANKVFLCLPGKLTDTLLYTYNLIVGDTLPKSYLTPIGVIAIVKKIDTVLIGTVHYRQFLFTTASGISPIPTLIQGIGSSQGLLTPYYSFFEQGPWLECFNKNSVPGVFLSGPFPNECSSSFSTGIREEQTIQFQLSPNPSANGLFYLQTTENSITRFEVYTLLGEKIYAAKTSQNNLEIDLSSQPKGIYFYRVTSENKLIGSGKLVIQ